ncbi:hypothetical protein [Curtobacterium sp. VKM Ac-1393]|nr:hypothetical protein [Curtobacterium sp. VKM Ac-1393]MBF4607305.1 hypothetical protein [Curtobacterium sp. VKM Ac-1393]
MSRSTLRRRKNATVRRPRESLRMRWWQWALLAALAAVTATLVAAALTLK